MKVTLVDTSNAHIYHNLVQAYEAEFSPITQKCPDKDGLFALDTPLDAAHRGYLAYDEGLPVGIANIGVNGVFEVCEFYIVPLFRHRRKGEKGSVATYNSPQQCYQMRPLRRSRGCGVSMTDSKRDTLFCPVYVHLSTTP